MRDIANQRFGSLYALSVHHVSPHRERFWKCICDCGNETVVRQSHLTSGNTRSCGCGLGRKTIEKRAAKPEKEPCPTRTKSYSEFKKQNTRLYTIWQAMKSRCYYEKNKCFHCYGGRGISVCAEWKNSFVAFAAWALANGYNDALSIDRIDVNGSYSPSNCRWITMAEQQRNKRKTPRL